MFVLSKKVMIKLFRHQIRIRNWKQLRKNDQKLYIKAGTRKIFENNFLSYGSFEVISSKTKIYLKEEGAENELLWFKRLYYYPDSSVPSK